MTFVMTIDEAAKLVGAWAARKPLISRVDLFGSRIRGNCHDGSDLDVAIVLKFQDPDTCLAYFFHNQEKWCAELQRLLPWTVDLQFHHPAVHGIVHGGVLESARNVFRREA